MKPQHPLSDLCLLSECEMRIWRVRASCSSLVGTLFLGNRSEYGHLLADISILGSWNGDA
jgi:hypothetical protein